MLSTGKVNVMLNDNSSMSLRAQFRANSIYQEYRRRHILGFKSNTITNEKLLYIVRCTDNSLYTGITNNIDKRVVEHNMGMLKSAYTFKRRPVTLVFSQEFLDPQQAITFEKKIKKWSRKKKEALINGDFEMLQLLAECRNATHFKYNS